MSKVFLGDVAKERKETCKDSKNGYPIVGLEHLTPEELTLSAWEEDKENTFSKLFREGDVLFGRRRAYLKKAAVAPFDGICSGDITVIEAIPEKILPALLPFIIQNDALFNYAINKSAGSLSPRVKWEHLKNYEFELPDLYKQRELAKVLWAMDTTKKSYQKLLLKTDELMKSQFIEMFGDPVTNPNQWETTTIGEIADCFIGLTYKPENVVDNGLLVLRSGNIQNSLLSFEDNVRVNMEVKEKLLVKKNDILMCSRNGSADLVGKVAKIPDLDEDMTFGAFMTIIRSEYYDYLFAFFHQDAFRRQLTEAKTSTINQITKSMLDKVKVHLPPIELQNQFAELVQQRDKSKFELEQALAELTATYKKIISENLV